MPFTLNFEAFEKILPSKVNEDNSQIDLNDCTFIRPDGAMMLFLLLRYFVQLGIKPIVIRPNNPEVDSYLERTGVFVSTKDYVDYFPDVSNIIENDWYENDSMQEITPLRYQDDVMKVIEKFGIAIQQQNINSKKASRLKSAMLETFQNIPDHANPGNPENVEGYTNIQSYQKGKNVIVSVGDLGIGIKASLSINEVYRKQNLSDINAIKKVVFEKASRHSNEDLSRGGGLIRTIENVKALNGYIFIRSGRSKMIIPPNIEPFEKNNLNYFPGTQICIKIGS